MESNFKLVMGAAVVGMFLGVAGLIFAVVSKKQADELRQDFSLVQDLKAKLEEVENSSSGISAGATRIKREVDSLRNGTQDALDRVSAELTRVRKDLNESLALAQTLQERLLGLEQRPPEPAPEPEPVAVAEVPEVRENAAPAPPAPRVEAETVTPVTEAAPPETGGEAQVYVIRSGDTLSAVARNYGISLEELLNANADVDPRRLQVGQEIRIPAR